MLTPFGRELCSRLYGRSIPFTMVGSQKKKNFLIKKNGTLRTNLKKLKDKNFLNKIVGDRGS